MKVDSLDSSTHLPTSDQTIDWRAVGGCLAIGGRQEVENVLARYMKVRIRDGVEGFRMGDGDQYVGQFSKVVPVGELEMGGLGDAVDQILHGVLSFVNGSSKSSGSSNVVMGPVSLQVLDMGNDSFNLSVKVRFRVE